MRAFLLDSLNLRSWGAAACEILSGMGRCGEGVLVLHLADVKTILKI